MSIDRNQVTQFILYLSITRVLVSVAELSRSRNVFSIWSLAYHLVSFSVLIVFLLGFNAFEDIPSNVKVPLSIERFSFLIYFLPGILMIFLEMSASNQYFHRNMTWFLNKSTHLFIVEKVTRFLCFSIGAATILADTIWNLTGDCHDLLPSVTHKMLGYLFISQTILLNSELFNFKLRLGFQYFSLVSTSFFWTMMQLYQHLNGKRIFGSMIAQLLFPIASFFASVSLWLRNFLPNQHTSSDTIFAIHENVLLAVCPYLWVLSLDKNFGFVIVLIYVPFLISIQYRSIFSKRSDHILNQTYDVDQSLQKSTE